MTFYALGVIMNFVMSKHLRSSFPTDAAHQNQQVETACDIVMFLLTSIFVAALHCERLIGNASAFAVELAVTILTALFMLTLVLSAPQTVSRLRGQDMTETYGADWYGSDSSLVLKIDLVVTAAHLGLPVRWHLLAPVALLAVLLYAGNAFVIGSAEPMGGAAYNMLLLACLVLLASAAKRIAERGERQAFLDIIQEKSLRCQAEFRLSQSRDGESFQEGKPQPPKSVAGASSVPTNAASSFVFDPLNEDDVDPAAQLACIAEMGDAEHWLIDREEVKLLEEGALGCGSFGAVSRAVFCGVLVAVKSPLQRLDRDSVQRLRDFGNELRVLRHLRHPNIISTLGATIDPQALKIALVLELARGVTLDKFVTASGALGGSGPSNLARYQVMLGVCRALSYVHTRRPHVVHGDLKGANIMVDVQDGVAHPKLLDFGLSRIVTRSTKPLGGTLAWVAPEVLNNSGPARCSADVFSFGCVLAFVATGIQPCSGLSAQQVKKALRSDRPPQPAWPPDCVFKPHLKQLVCACISADPSQRPSTTEVHERLLWLPQELDLGRQDDAFLATVRTIQAQLSPNPARWCSGPRELHPADAIAQGVDLASLAVLSGASPPASHGGSQREEVNPVAEGSACEDNAGLLVTGALLHPDKLPTDSGMMALSLLELVTRWNYKVKEVPCCQLHTVARMGQQVSALLLERPCFEQAPMAAGGQCRSCGMLGLEENAPACELCRTMPMMTGTQPASSRVQL